MFGLFKRRPTEPPPIEWECGSIRHALILEALEHATSSTITFYHRGIPQWTRDIAIPLHEFTCRVVGDVLKNGSPMWLPVYSGIPPGGHDPMSAAMAMAREQAAPNAATPLQQAVFELPESFAQALACKQRWLAGNAGPDEIRAAAEQVLRDTRLLWPSNFCLSINAMQTALWCVLSALNVDVPWLGAHGCAQCAAKFMGCRAACRTMECASAPHDTQTLAWEGAQIGNQLLTRGVACPQAGNQQIEQRATESLDATFAEWWHRYNDELAAMVEE